MRHLWTCILITVNWSSSVIKSTLKKRNNFNKQLKKGRSNNGIYAWMFTNIQIFKLKALIKEPQIQETTPETIRCHKNNGLPYTHKSIHPPDQTEKFFH